ncbi:MAG TPA: hypothetical protein OIM27_04130 [Methanobrevibacter smithii]|nr:hypothetical protein [Methanobrevibacter smithii]HJJ02150.1 hypothetical protein [Methanobrevibacter smithii]
MGKVVFNIVETDYDVSKAEETYLKFRRDYKHELKSIYPDICGDTVLFQIIFERPTLPLQPFKIK